jgi:hypothetical protein
MRFFCKTISFLFHPLMMLTIIVSFLLIVNPYLFGKSDISQGWWIILQVFLTTYMMPAMAVVMMKSLGMVKSLEMEDRTERIIPYISSGIFYIWVYMSAKSNSMFPVVFDIAVLGSTISLFLAFFFNNFTKVSAHAAGVGGLVAITLVTMHWFSYRIFFWGAEHAELPVYLLLAVNILIAGVVCSARLYLNAHNYRDILYGLIIGAVGIAAATWHIL